MKKWIVLGTSLATFALGASQVLAADGLWRHETPSGMQQGVQSVTEGSDGDADSTRDQNQPVHHWEIKSSVQVSRTALKDAYMASRNAYTEKLQRFAKCSQAQASKAIAAAHPGMKVQEVQLRNIRTNLVYVGVAEDDEDRYIVIVDAGDGKVLLDRRVPTSHERAFAN